MELRSTFQSIISLYQEELPVALQERSTQLPTDGNRIVTVTGIRRCGKSSLLGLTINSLLQQGTPKERIFYVGGLIAASSVTGCKQGKIITFSQREAFERDGIRIEVMPIWEME